MPCKQIGEIPGVEVPAPHQRNLRTMYSPEQDPELVGDLTVFHLTIYPHSSSDHHVHDRSGEIMYVMCGHGEGTLGAEVFPLRPDAAFYAPPGVPHQVRNLSGHLMKLIVIFSPAVGAVYARAKASQATADS